MIPPSVLLARGWSDYAANIWDVLCGYVHFVVMGLMVWCSDGVTLILDLRTLSSFGLCRLVLLWTDGLVDILDLSLVHMISKFVIFDI